MTELIVTGVYLALLLALGVFSSRLFRGTSSDYFVASRSIGPFLLLMSVFGTTMTGFALVGSSGKAFSEGIGVYGLMASYSGLIHSACFFLVGIRLWAFGKRYGYVTQCQYFSERFESPSVGFVLFPILVLLIIPYLLVGIISAGAVIRGTTVGLFPETFASTNGSVPPWLSSLVICLVVLFYVFLGGVRSTAWANTFQTIVFIITGFVAFFLIARALGGPAEATRKVLELKPELLSREGEIGQLQFFSYAVIPLSVGMFPHLFQHWLTARSAGAFRLTVIAHPICIMLVWVPCVLIGVWAAGAGIQGPPNAVLSKMVATLVHEPIVTGILVAGILAAIMSSLDSQFMCMSTMFTNDIVNRIFGHGRFPDRTLLWIGRGFVVAIVALSYALALLMGGATSVFDLGVWCFSGFGALFPVAFAAVYWRRCTKWGAIAAIGATSALWIGLITYDFAVFKRTHPREEMLLFGAMPALYLFGTCVVTLVGVSLLTRPPSPETVRRFFPKSPVDGRHGAVEAPAGAADERSARTPGGTGDTR